MINKIKFIVLSLDVTLSKAFLYSQARFSLNLRDSIYSLIFRLSNNPPILTGSETKGMPEVDESKLGARSIYQEVSLSSAYELERTPEILKLIISKNLNDIENYLGKGFCYEQPIIFRNFNFPQEFAGYDIYSNVWHQDSFDGNKLLKIFVLMDKVTDTDGPFYYMDLDAVKLHWKNLRERWSFKSFVNVEQIPEQTILTGVKGDYLIIDTSRCMHRASIPSKHRDMLQITLLPKWKKKNSTYVLEP